MINNAIISMEDGMIYASGGNVSKVKKKKKVEEKSKHQRCQLTILTSLILLTET